MTGLHGNMGRCANCGAVNASVAAIGAKYGRTDYNQDNKVVLRLVEEFMTEFENKFGSVKCATLVGDNDSASLEQQYKCSEYVLFAADTVEKLIAQEEERRKAEENK